MTDIEMSLPTRVRVIEHALKLLDAFNEKFRAALADGSVRMNAEVQMMARTNAEGEGRLRRRLAKLRKEMQSSPAPAGIDNGLAKALGIALSEELPGFDLVEPQQSLTQGDKLRICATSATTYQADLVAGSSEDLSIATADLMSAVFSLEFPTPGTSGDADLFFNISPAPASAAIEGLEFAASFEISRAV